MPRPHPPEFRKRAVELARLKDKPIAQIAVDLGISDSCLRNWLHQADVDEEGRRASPPTSGPNWSLSAEELRVKDMEIEILKRASAFFAGENDSQNRVPAGQ